MTKYSTQLKTKLVLEVLKEERTLNEITGSFLLKQNRIC